MIHDICFPEILTGPELDLLLSRGWFRMGQSIFTTDIVKVNEQFIPVYWLRIDLKQLHYGRHQKRLLKSNKKFVAEIKPFVLTAEAQGLYAQYGSYVNFEAPRTIEEFLFYGVLYNIYDTRMIELRDGDKLIALGIFDQGYHSIAGIMNFYHPDYRAYSLGKHLMLLKINYALEQGKLWYYLGYIAGGGNTKFDYKLFPDRNATQLFYRRKQEWIPYVGHGEKVVAEGLQGLNNFELE